MSWHYQKNRLDNATIFHNVFHVLSTEKLDINLIDIEIVIRKRNTKNTLRAKDTLLTHKLFTWPLCYASQPKR